MTTSTKNKKKKSGLTTFLLVTIFIVGLSLLLYPTFADYWNSMHQTRAITTYSEKVASFDKEVYEQYWQDAKEYNERILDRSNRYVPTDEDISQYPELLNPGGLGVMGYIEIPSIEVTLPIYHGTSEGVLQIAVGHLDWTSLPTGGPSTHCVLSGHRGLPSAKLFTHLDKMVEGDVFMLRILDEVLTYEVDKILIVEPQDTAALQVVEGEDRCTLVTCTPYGINTHRLLVQGHRIENTAESKVILVTADALQIEPMIVAPVLAIPVLVLLTLLVLIFGGKKKDNEALKAQLLANCSDEENKPT